MTTRKPSRKKLTASKPQFLFSIIQYFASFPRYYLSIRMLGAILLFLIIILIGDLLTKDGLIIVLAIIGYVLLMFLANWFKKHDEN